MRSKCLEYERCCRLPVVLHSYIMSFLLCSVFYRNFSNRAAFTLCVYSRTTVLYMETCCWGWSVSRKTQQYAEVQDGGGKEGSGASTDEALCPRCLGYETLARLPVGSSVLPGVRCLQHHCSSSITYCCTSRWVHSTKGTSMADDVCGGHSGSNNAHLYAEAQDG